ncbi:MAG: hypothetical protein EOP06_28335 [Proteobacteria bacterium]|nr:MAG: hypothetical protein EOP06_28335 [Pseudomonadota bacterium]
MEKILRDQAALHKIKLFRVSLNWSHIHILMQTPSRAAYNKFIRGVTALLVAFVSKKIGKSCAGLFDLPPFTRIVSWGREFRKLMDYHDLNDMEARGLCRRVKKAAVKNRTAKTDPSPASTSD